MYFNIKKIINYRKIFTGIFIPRIDIRGNIFTLI